MISRVQRALRSAKSGDRSRRSELGFSPSFRARCPPGAEVHYGCTLPMGRDITANGEVKGFEGLFVADGSVLPTLPAKSHTFTVMANAHRIGVGLAHRLGDGGG